MKKSAQRRCKHWLAVVRQSQKNFSPPQTAFLVARNTTAKVFNRAGDGYYLYLQTQFGEDRCMQFRVIVVINPQTHPQTHTQTGPITIHTLHHSLVQSVINAHHHPNLTLSDFAVQWLGPDYQDLY